MGCNNTPAELLAGKPWPDFEGCEKEGGTDDNLGSLMGPCAHDKWVRINCKRTCGLCGLSLRTALELPPRVALKAARAAAQLRGRMG